MAADVTQDGREIIVINRYVSKAITVEVVQAYAAKTVSSQDFVTG